MVDDLRPSYKSYPEAVESVILKKDVFDIN